ncbi:hypothetical protein [Pectobacterium sp. B1J-3]|uniref:hypothetical protein n=1 Tax=Pectobacterium sp. B1J-3 TaxID=3385371 RepID=UPI0039061DC8
MSNTHDYTRENRYWGHDLSFKLMDPEGMRLNATGWGTGINQGDFISLSNKGDVTRYKFETISYYHDPSDMWTAVLLFAPRQAEASE